MKHSTIAAVALAALLVTAGAAAAMPGDAPEGSGADEHERASDHRPDDGSADESDHAANESDDARDDGDGDESDGADATNESDDDANDDERAADVRENVAAASSEQARSPPAEMPEQVPGHVTAIHDMIREFLSGDLEGTLGSSVSDVTPDESAGNETADASG